MATVLFSGVPGRKSASVFPGWSARMSPSWQFMQMLSASQGGSLAGFTMDESIFCADGFPASLSLACNSPGP